jgi:hypothetical protein
LSATKIAIPSKNGTASESACTSIIALKYTSSSSK